MKLEIKSDGTSQGTIIKMDGVIQKDIFELKLHPIEIDKQQKVTVSMYVDGLDMNIEELEFVSKAVAEL